MSVDEIIINNTKLIYLAAKKLNVYKRIDEFYSVGMIGLVKGAKTYDEKLGYKLSTYLYKCIYNEIALEIRKNTSKKQIPEYVLTSLSTPITDNITISDTIPDDLDIEENIILKEQISEMYQAISTLTEQEQMVINLSFGVNGYEILTQTDISNFLGISQANVSRVKTKALNKLRKIIEK